VSEEIITANHWLVITNPKSGKRRLAKQREFIIHELTTVGIPYIYKETEYPRHAVEIAKKYARLDCQNFLILGGDGTISEVINGIFMANVSDTGKIKIALIPRGTGNDWGRFWKLRKNDKESMKVFLQGMHSSLTSERLIIGPTIKNRNIFSLIQLDLGWTATYAT